MRDEEQGFADLRARERSGWRDGPVRWVPDVPTRNGDSLRACECMRDQAERGQESARDDEPAGSPERG